MKISSFTGRYRFLSNFWPVEIFLDGDKYKSVEHAYQAAKTLDDIERFNIRQAPTASEAKKLGRKIKKIRPNWDKIKLSIMESLLRQKFNIAKHPILAQALLETYPNELIEGNYRSAREAPAFVKHEN